MTITVFLPSVKDHDGDDTVLQPSSKEEAELFINAWVEAIKANRRLKDNPDASPDAIEYFKGSIDLANLNDIGGFDELLEKLSVSQIVGQRGKRVLYVDTELNEIGVGTTVVYNRNWATLGVKDKSIVPTLLDAATKEALAA